MRQVNAKIGDTIEILYMDGEPQYEGKQGVITHIDAIGQLHGTWGGCAVIPETDRFKVIKDRDDYGDQG